MFRRTRFLTPVTTRLLFGTLCLCGAAQAVGNWPQFGGPDGNGVCRSVSPPRAAEIEAEKPLKPPIARLLVRIDESDLLEGYDLAKHQPYVGGRMRELSEEQRGMVGRLWKEKGGIDPFMPNRGVSFVKTLQYVAKQAWGDLVGFQGKWFANSFHGGETRIH